MKKQDEKGRMLSYMKYKYQEEFKYLETYAGQMGKSYTTILVESVEYPERKALVRLSEKDGRRCFEDNYLAYLMKEQVETEIGKMAKECFGNCKVYYKIPRFVFPDSFRADMKMQDFLSHAYSMHQFYIYPEEEMADQKIWEEKLEAFRSLNAKKNYKIRGSISFAASKEDYDKISADSFADSDYKGYEAAAELVFSMDENGAFRYMRWL